MLSDAPYSSTLIETDSLMRSAADNAVQIVPLFTHRINPSSLAFHTQIGERTSNPLSSARAEHRLSQENHGQFGESLKDLVVRTAICSLDWGRWCFGEALSISADLNPLLLTEHEGISVRGSYNSRIATILVQYERANCTHQISLARGQTGSERFQFTCQEGTLDLTSHPPNLPGATPEIHWRRKSGVVEPLAFPIPTSEFGFNIDQARSYLMLASLGEIWLKEDKADILGLARSAQEIYVAAVVSSRSQTKVRLPLQGVGSVKV